MTMPYRSSGRSLVIGASGQVGTAIISLLDPDSVVATSSQSTGLPQPPLDLARVATKAHALELIRQYSELKTVYCVGGMTNVDACESDPELAVRVNCTGPSALAAAALENDLSFVYFSTEYVFNGRTGPYTEEAAPDPISAYGRSKRLGEIAVAKAHPRALIIRTTVVYGPDPRGKNFVYSLRSALSEGRKMRVADDQVSTPTYNLDLARATLDLVESGVFGIVHIAGPDCISRFEFARRCARVMGFDPACVVPVHTAELAQGAPRPLNAGLRIDKLQSVRPASRMRGTDEALVHWLANEPRTGEGK